MSSGLSLLQIQKLQFSNKPEAERSLLMFLKENEDLPIASVQLTPKPESLNSINGFVTFASGERHFFKSHVEENEKVSEYYNVSLLADAGYPVISARRVKQRPGQQIAFYEILSLSTLFDELKAEEDWQRENALSPKAPHLIEAQTELDETVSDILQRTVRPISADEQARAPVHQLFSHRLMDDGRLGLFYRNNSTVLEHNPVSFEELAAMQWTINGATYGASLQDIIVKARELLAPRDGCASVGHGDAHNGNIFVNFDAATGGRRDSSHAIDDSCRASANARLVMFDPAFAGLHNPILDVAKPIFHNHFARWMYFPEQVADEFQLSYSLKGNKINIEHDFQPSNLRKRLLAIKINKVVKPLVDCLRRQGMLENNWARYLRSALFCCPFLTVNLFSAHLKGGTLAERYTLPIKLLALSMSVEFACESRSGTNALAELIDSIFD